MTIRIQKLLVDAQMAANNVSEFLEKRTLEDLMNDVMLRSAVERQFEILGEALRLASEEKEDLELDIPDLWKIIGLRNRIAHGYDTISYEVLWTLVQTKLPQLQIRLNELL